MSKFRQACAFLRSVLKDGPQLCRDVKAAALEACLSERTLERAAAALTRSGLFAEWADQPTLVIGTHYPAPTAGRIVRDGAAFRFAV